MQLINQPHFSGRNIAGDSETSDIGNQLLRISDKNALTNNAYIAL